MRVVIMELEEKILKAFQVMDDASELKQFLEHRNIAYTIASNRKVFTIFNHETKRHMVSPCYCNMCNTVLKTYDYFCEGCQTAHDIMQNAVKEAGLLNPNYQDPSKDPNAVMQAEIDEERRAAYSA